MKSSYRLSVNADNKANNIREMELIGWDVPKAEDSTFNCSTKIVYANGTDDRDLN